MTTVFLCPTFGVGYQAFDTNGLPLNQGTISTFIAGGTTPQATYTTVAGSVQNANPIVLGTDGRPPSEIWLIAGVSYRFDVKDSLGNLIKSYDNISSDITALSAATGATLVGYQAPGTGSVATTVQNRLSRELWLQEDFGAYGNNSHDDTAAFLAFKAACVAQNKVGRIEAGTYLIDQFTFGPSDTGLRLQGDVFNPQSPYPVGGAGYFGLKASVLKLGTPRTTFVSHSGSYNLQIEDIAFDGGKVADVVHAYDGSGNVTLVYYKRCLIGGATASTGKTIHFGGTLGGDNNYYEHCTICSSPNSAANPPLNHIHNENTNAFLIYFDKCRFADAIDMFHYGAGSCSLIRCDVFGAITRYFHIDSITQSFKLSDIYTEGTSVPFFVQGTAGAGVTTSRPITLELLTLAGANDITLNCQQPVRILGSITAGNIDVTPMATWGTQYVYAESIDFADVANGWTGTGALTRVTSLNETKNFIVQPYRFPIAQLNVADGVRSTAASTGSINTATPTTITDLSGQSGMFQVFAQIPSAGASDFTASATVLAEGTSARITTNNGAKLTLTLSGTQIQVTQTAGFAAIVKWSILKIAEL